MPTNGTMTLGQYIAARRKALNMRQEDLSNKLKQLGAYRAPTTIANWEADRQIVPAEMLDALALALEEPSPVHLYDLAGILCKLPGRDIIKILDRLPPEDIERITRLILAYVAK